MNQPPESTWLQRYQGAVVDSITFCRYQMMFSFEDNRRLTVSVPFCFGPAEHIPSCEWIEFPLRESTVMRTLGANITKIYSDAEKQLWVEFSSGDTMVVAWTSMYECYEFAEDGERTIV